MGCGAYAGDDMSGKFWDAPIWYRYFREGFQMKRNAARRELRRKAYDYLPLAYESPGRILTALAASFQGCPSYT